ncbi:MAG: sigma-54-dependent Fis family transcriptional regulator [Peptococcaceae bacterium]
MKSGERVAILDELKDSWHVFITTKSSPEKIRTVILESWYRCLKKGVDPYQKKVKKILNAKQLEKLRAEHEELMVISNPIMENLYKFVIGSGFLVTLTTKTGIILKIIGDEDVKKSLETGNFSEGADWSEESAGTNAIGTALANGGPIQIFAYEHFCICSHKSTCSCAPIRDAAGNIIGALDLTGDFFNVNSHTLGMAVAAANAIENCLRILREEKKCQLANTYKNIIIDSISEGIIATDYQGNITHINGIAEKILNIGQGNNNSLHRNIKEVLPPQNESFFNIFVSGKYLTDEEINIYTAKGPCRYTVTSRPIINDNGNPEGTVIVINEIKRAKKIAQRMSGASAKFTFNNLIGRNKLFLETIETAKLAAASDSNILLLGESGTGKDIFAQAIHNESYRRSGPFVVLNCGALPKELIGSELFGFTDGAFTGAKRGGNPGKFELADGGTIFLDEIGEMPLELQINLLRVIEQKRVRRIGANEEIPVDVRIIAATNKNLVEAVRKGLFREDLFYRLNVLSIKMIPLRERKEDIPLLVKHFYRLLLDKTTKNASDISDPYLKALQKYHWPGNIRELQNVVERAVNLSKTGELKLEYLPEEIKEKESERKIPNIKIETVEKEIIFNLMKTHNGNITRVANNLGIARTTLYRKLDKYNLNK